MGPGPNEWARSQGPNEWAQQGLNERAQQGPNSSPGQYNQNHFLESISIVLLKDVCSQITAAEQNFSIIRDCGPELIRNRRKLFKLTFWACPKIAIYVDKFDFASAKTISSKVDLIWHLRLSH